MRSPRSVCSSGSSHAAHSVPIRVRSRRDFGPVASIMAPSSSCFSWKRTVDVEVEAGVGCFFRREVVGRSCSPLSEAKRLVVFELGVDVVAVVSSGLVVCRWLLLEDGRKTDAKLTGAEC